MKKYVLKTLLIMIVPLSVSAQGYYGFAELLVWKASQQVSSTWATILSSGNLNGVRTTNFSETDIKFDFEPGFRGGVGFKQTNFDTRFFYTYFRTTQDNNIRDGRQIIVPEFWSGFLSGNFFFGGEIDWKIELNMLDWDLGYTFRQGDFSIRPAIGIKGGSINQRANVVWDAVIYKSTETVKNNFTGAGPTFGISTNWDFCRTKCNVLGLFGNASTALMWGKWKVNDVYNRPFRASVVSATTITTKSDDMKLGAAVFSFILGAQWSYESSVKATLRLGYEMQYWPNQLRMFTFQQLPTHGNLTLQGGTCGILVQI